MYVILIVTNHVNWHRENLWSDRENTGNFKMQFEWGPWSNNGSINDIIVIMRVPF